VRGGTAPAFRPTGLAHIGQMPYLDATDRLIRHLDRREQVGSE
jgi:hypothetical protein